MRITNNGPSTFVGTLGFIAVAGNGANGTASYAVTLNPGDSASVSFNCESSNQVGWNGPTGTTQDGAEFVMNGTATLGVRSQPVARSIFDKDIHSGVPRTNPFGETLDNYILRGGSSTGADTGDDYETSQASGTFVFHSWRPSSLRGKSWCGSASQFCRRSRVGNPPPASAAVTARRPLSAIAAEFFGNSRLNSGTSIPRW